MNLDNLTPEQIEKAKDLKTAEELSKFAEENGIELTDEQLEKFSGGGFWDDAQIYQVVCPKCGKTVTWNGSSDKPVVCPYCKRRFFWE